jgi:hypothetical protein
LVFAMNFPPFVSAIKSSIPLTFALRCGLIQS